MQVFLSILGKKSWNIMLISYKTYKMDIFAYYDIECEIYCIFIPYVHLEGDFISIWMPL